MEENRVQFKIGVKRRSGEIIEVNPDYTVVSVDGNQVPIHDSMIVSFRKSTYHFSKRRKLDEMDKLPKLYFYKTNLQKIEELTEERCCSKLCLSKFSSEQILSVRMKYFSKTQKGRKLWLQEYFSTNHTYYISGILICANSFYKIYSISNDLRSSTLANKSNYIFLESECITKKELMFAWMENFKYNICDSMPDSGKFVIPFVFNWTDVHDSYVDQIIQTCYSVSPLTYTSFMGLIKSNFPEVKLYKYTQLTKCDKCVDLKIKRAQNLLSKEIIQNQLTEHLNFIRKERTIYMSRNFPNNSQEYISLIIDGMTSLYIPHRFPNPKFMGNLNPVKISPIGLISHTVGQKKLFLLPEIFPKGANLIISILWSYILSYLEENSRLPKKLYIQTDNAAKEGKNKYLISFLALLVKMGYFSEVYFSMLPVGHTHVDVDQMFSNISKKFKKCNCETMKELVELCTTVYSGESFKVLLIHQIWDFKSWLQDYIQPFNGISHFNSFLITHSEGNLYPTITYKNYTSGNDWIDKFEAIRTTPQCPPYAFVLSLFNYERSEIIQLEKAPFTTVQKRNEFFHFINEPSQYGTIFDAENCLYSISSLRTPNYIQHLFPEVNVHEQLGIEPQAEDLSFVISFPNTPIKISKLDLSVGKFIVIFNQSDKEKYFLLGRIKNLPINSLSSNTWIDIYLYTQRENIFSVIRKPCHIKVGEIFCCCNSMSKIRKGNYSMSHRDIKKINIGIINKFIK